MWKCRLYEILFSLFPVRAWQDSLIQRHFDRCPACQKKLAGMEEIQSVLLSEDEIGDRMDAWPEFTKAIEEKRGKEKCLRPPYWRLVYGVMVMITVVIAGAWFMFVTKPERVSDLPERFKINYIRIEDKPARAFLFQPKDSNMIFVWAEKNTKGE